MESFGNGTENGIEVIGNGTGYERGSILPVLPGSLFDRDKLIFIPFSIYTGWAK